MTPFSINGKVIYINNILKIAEMDDAEFDEEYRDIIASNIAEDFDSHIHTHPELGEIEETETDEIIATQDFDEFEDLIRQKMS